MSDDLFSKAKGVAAAARGNWMQKGLRLHRGLDTSRPPIELAVELPVDLASAPEDGSAAPVSEPWRLDALRGRLVELSARGAAATLTAAIELVVEAQQAAEPVAWVTLGNATFFPPDAAASGVDLAALAVVRVHDATAAARAAERLLRSGGFLGPDERSRSGDVAARAMAHGSRSGRGGRARPGSRSVSG